MTSAPARACRPPTRTHLRIDRELDARLHRQAAEAEVPTSALARRLLRQVRSRRHASK